MEIIVTPTIEDGPDRPIAVASTMGEARTLVVDWLDRQDPDTDSCPMRINYWSRDRHGYSLQESVDPADGWMDPPCMNAGQRADT